MPLTLALSLVLAFPVDMIHDVEAGKEKFVKPGAIEWVEPEDPTIANAEVMEAGEVLLTGVKPGRAHVLLYAEGRFAVWRVRVGGKPELPPTEPAKKACPSLKLYPADDTKLTATVDNEACWKALFTLFQGDGFTARELDLTFDAKVLQQQLKGLQAELPKTIASKYVGAGVVLDGSIGSQKVYRSVLWTLFRKSVGRVALDDRLEVKMPQ